MPENPSHPEQMQEFLRALDAREQAIVETERRVATQSLLEQQGLERVLATAGHAFSVAEEFRRHHLQISPPAQRSACHAGCHSCCYLKVGVTAAEVLALSQYLEQQAPRELLEQVKARAAELAKDPRVFSEDAKPRARLACPLLTDAGTCGAYEVRPLACRGWNSSDAESCRRWLDDDSEPPPANMQLARECAAVALGLAAAIADVGLPREILELTSALDVALSEPNVLERWLAGEAIFAAARADG